MPVLCAGNAVILHGCSDVGGIAREILVRLRLERPPGALAAAARPAGPDFGSTGPSRATLRVPGIGPFQQCKAAFKLFKRRKTPSASMFRAMNAL